MIKNYFYPTSDTNKGLWTGNGDATNFYNNVNEGIIIGTTDDTSYNLFDSTVGSDSTIIQAIPISGALIPKSIGTGFVYRVRFRKSATAGKTLDVTMTLVGGNNKSQSAFAAFNTATFGTNVITNLNTITDFGNHPTHQRPGDHPIEIIALHPFEDILWGQE